MPLEVIAGNIYSQPHNNNYSYLESLILQINGGPVDEVTSVSELNSKYPNGANGVVLVDGVIYLWNGGTWVTNGTIYRDAGVSNDSINPAKLVTQKAGYNLIDPYRVTRSAFINGSTGELTPGASGTFLNCATDFIECSPGQNYTANMFSNVVYYSSNGEYNSSLFTLENRYKFTIPSGVYRFRMSYRQEDENKAMVSLGKEYRQYQKYIYEQVQVVGDRSVIKLQPIFELGTILNTNQELDRDNRIRTKAIVIPANTKIQLNLEPDVAKFQLLRYDPETLDFIDVPITINPFVSKEYYNETEVGMRFVITYTDNRKIDLNGNADLLINNFHIVEYTDADVEQRKKIEEIEKALAIGVPILPAPRCLNIQQPPLLVGNFSSMCFIDGELWCFIASDYSETGFTGWVIRYSVDADNKYRYIASFKHNWNHVNSIGYSKVNDTLVCSSFVNATVTPPSEFKYEIYVIENVQSLKALNDTQTATLAERAIKITVPESWGRSMNATFGESNGGKENIIYYITNDNRDIRRILLGQGENNLGSGTFISGKTGNQFNGTYKLLKEYHTDTSLEVNQGSWFYKGDIYLGLGHEGVYYQKCELIDDGSINITAYKDTMYDDDGNIRFGNRGFSGITFYDGKMYCGINSPEPTAGYVLTYEND